MKISQTQPIANLYLSGLLQQLLFSPQGDIEGVLLKVDSATVQVSMRSDEVDARMLHHAIGGLIELKASAKDSPKTSKAAHPVYRLHAITKLAGKPIAGPAHVDAVKGVVAAIHYAKHGEPNGVVLESGEFIHTRPPGMRKLRLKMGSKVTARGKLRMTILGTSLMEAHEVNRVTLA